MPLGAMAPHFAQRRRLRSPCDMRTALRNFKFKVKWPKTADVCPVYVGRIEELRQSRAIAKQALEGMPSGSTKL